jgi:hypothetical protein
VIFKCYLNRARPRRAGIKAYETFKYSAALLSPAEKMAINFFNSLDYLEPKCEKCKVVLEYGINTQFDEEKDCHICMNCGAVLK